MKTWLSLKRKRNERINETEDARLWHRRLIVINKKYQKSCIEEVVLNKDNNILFKFMMK